MEINFIYLRFGLFIITHLASAQDSIVKKESSIQDFKLNIELENQYFLDSPQFDKQKQNYISFSIEPKYSLINKKNNSIILFKGFGRLDYDSHRTHLDIRELYYRKTNKNVEYSFGSKQIFWGVLESNHLVDIINQNDVVESFYGNEKYGQPMIHLKYSTSKKGSFEFFYLPYHRNRIFPGEVGRGRFPIIIDKNSAIYQSSAKEWNPDFAMHWSYVLGSLDLGLTYFKGNSREPIIAFQPPYNIGLFYPLINQVGFNLQLTKNSLLWKIESIYRNSEKQKFLAFGVGLEYSQYNIGNSNKDILFFCEYNYDERRELALSGLQNDIFFGTKLNFNNVNNTNISSGFFYDLNTRSNLIKVDASSRILNKALIKFETFLFRGISSEELFLSNFKNESFLNFTLSFYL